MTGQNDSLKRVPEQTEEKKGEKDIGRSLIFIFLVSPACILLGFIWVADSIEGIIEVRSGQLIFAHFIFEDAYWLFLVGVFLIGLVVMLYGIALIPIHIVELFTTSNKTQSKTSDKKIHQRKPKRDDEQTNVKQSIFVRLADGERLLTTAPAEKRFLLSGHLDCEVQVTNKRLMFIDPADTKYSFSLDRKVLETAKFERKGDDLVIELSDGTRYAIGLGERRWWGRIVGAIERGMLGNRKPPKTAFCSDSKQGK